MFTILVSQKVKGKTYILKTETETKKMTRPRETQERLVNVGLFLSRLWL